jgi:hypothetical protein
MRLFWLNLPEFRRAPQTRFRRTRRSKKFLCVGRIFLARKRKLSSKPEQQNESFFGNAPAARQSAVAAIEPSNDRDVHYGSNTGTLTSCQKARGGHSFRTIRSRPTTSSLVRADGLRILITVPGPFYKDT